LLIATVDGNATVVDLLLDHGANTSLTAEVGYAELLGVEATGKACAP